MLRIVVHSLALHDAVGNFVLSIAEKATEIGCCYELYAEHAAPGSVPISSYTQLYNDMTAEDTLLYHLTFGDPALPQIMALPGRKLIYYHNMTPGHLFRPSFPYIADELDAGRRSLPCIRQADGVFANSEWSLADIEPFIREGAISGVMPPFTPSLLERFHIPIVRTSPLDGPYLLSVGRLAPHKNLEYALSLVAAVRRLCPELRYVVMGSGPEDYRQHLQGCAERLELGASVLFTGALPDQEAGVWFTHAMGLLCTSLHEGFCLPLVEAMALGVPVFVTPQPAVIETLAGSGFLLSGDDLQADAARLAEVLERSALLEKMVGFGRQRLEALRTISDRNSFWDVLFDNAVPAVRIPRKHIVLTWRHLDIKGGITTFTLDLAEALAAVGHTVRILVQGQGQQTQILANGVLLERLPVAEHQLTPEAMERRIPQEIWNWSATVLQACREIDAELPIDIVESPIWDCEGIACLLHGPWPMVTSLHTTLHAVLETHPKWLLNEEWMNAHIRPLLALENEIMLSSDAVRANSHAIIKKIEATQGIVFDQNKTLVIHHGLRDIPHVLRSKKDTLTVLFVGRLEARKGIDLLLACIPDIAQRYPHVRFVLVGDNTIPCEMTSSETSNTTYMASFEQQYAHEAWFPQVMFAGKLSDEAVLMAYENCDIFCGPSRFESFGLIFLEAMRAGKPVIGCDAGGMPEIIVNGENGLLIPPGDAEALRMAMEWLITHPVERLSMGMRGRERFVAHFTSSIMASKSDTLYELAKLQQSLNQ